MRSRAVIRLFAAAVAAAVLIACLVRSATDWVGRLRDPQQPELFSCFREAARLAPGDRVGFLYGSGEGLDPVGRNLLITADWELAPRVAERLAAGDAAPWPETVLSGADVRDPLRKALQDRGFRPVATNELAAVWSSAPRGPSEAPDVPASPVREGAAVLVVSVLLAAAVFLFAKVRMEARTQGVLALLVLLALSCVVLVHVLLPPNGLGVHAGKARLLFASGGIPCGFWTDPAYEVYQPSYPPGLTVLSLLAFVLSGGCGDWLVQLLLPVSLALLFVLLTEGARGWFVRAAGLAFVLSPIAQKLASGYYAEPFALLCVGTGLARLAKGKGGGWPVVGCAGLFRHEGLLIAAAVWFGVRACRGRSAADGFALAAALLPGLFWQAVCSWSGAGLYDYDFGILPEMPRVLEAVATLGRTCFVRFREIGGGVVLGVAGGVLFRAPRRELAAVLGMAAVLCAGVVLVAFNRTPHYAWVVGNTVPRYVWLCTGACLLVVRFCYNTRLLCSSSSKRR